MARVASSTNERLLGYQQLRKHSVGVSNVRGVESLAERGDDRREIVAAGSANRGGRARPKRQPINANVLDNIVAAPLLPVSGGDDGIHVASYGPGQTLCIDIAGNTASGSAGNNGVFMEQYTGGILRLERLAASQGPGGAAIVEGQLNGTNTLAPPSDDRDTDRCGG